MHNIFEDIHYEDSEHLYVKTFKDLSYKPHWHNDFELAYVKDGEIKININTEQALLKKGSVSVCCSNDIHNYYSKDLSNEIIVIRFRTYFIDPQIQRLLVDNEFSSVLIESSTIENIGIENDIERIFTGCCTEMINKKPFYEHVIKGLIMEFFSLALRYFNSDGYKNTANNNDITLMQNIIKYIDANLSSKDLNLESISNEFHLSPFYFSKVFKKMFGFNFKWFLNHYRIKKAKNMLYATDRKITDIAYECGYGSVRQFNRAFAAENAINPTAYREMVKGK